MLHSHGQGFVTIRFPDTTTLLFRFEAHEETVCVHVQPTRRDLLPRELLWRPSALASSCLTGGPVQTDRRSSMRRSCVCVRAYTGTFAKWVKALSLSQTVSAAPASSGHCTTRLCFPSCLVCLAAYHGHSSTTAHAPSVAMLVTCPTGHAASISTERTHFHTCRCGGGLTNATICMLIKPTWSLSASRTC